MNYQEIIEMVRTAIVNFVAEKYGETIEKDDVTILSNQTAFTVTKALAMVTTPADRIYVVTYDKTVGVPTVVSYVPENFPSV